jgi:pyrroloquinoline quinone biosynthesis protein D
VSARPSSAFLAADRPCLARKARLHEDRIRGEVVLLWPEGVLLLNATAAAVLALCDGRRTFAGLVAELAGRYDSPIEVVAGDVSELLAGFRERGLIVLASGETHVP